MFQGEDMFARLTGVSVTLFLSMVMAMIMLVSLWFYQPQWLSWVQDGADLVEDAIVSIPLPERYQNLVRIYASDDKIVLLIFTIIARIILAVVETVIFGLMNRDKYHVARPGLLSRTGSTISTLMLSFIIAIIMLSAIALTMQGLLHTLLDAADVVEDMLAGLPLPGRWSAGVRYIVSDEKILLLFFTIIARMLIALVATSATAAVGGRKERIVAPAA